MALQRSGNNSGLHQPIRSGAATWMFYQFMVALRPAQRPAKPIFVLGSPRSGKSQFARRFAQHPALTHIEGAGRLWDPEHFGDAEADHCWTGNDVTEKEAKRIVTAFAFLCWRSGAQGFVNDHARNSVRIDYIRKIFPNALFIHMIRDGRVVVQEMLAKLLRDPRCRRLPMGGYCKPPGWRAMLSKDLVRQTAIQWAGIVRYVEGWKEQLGDWLLDIHFERFCQHPREELAKAFRFAGLQTDGALLSRFPERLDLAVHGTTACLPQGGMEKIERLVGPFLQDLGYELDGAARGR